METVGAFAAKTHLSDLLERVERGERFTITRHGKPVAQLTPVDQRDPEAVKEAIARALANRPRVLLADEPTGNLDVATAGAVFAELLATVRGQGVAALIATHNPDLAARMDRVVTLRDGAVVAG